MRFWFKQREEGAADPFGCPDHRPRVEDDDGFTIVISCPNCDHRMIVAVRDLIR